MKKEILFAVLFSILALFSQTIQAQVGLGLVVGADVYQRYTNPNHPLESENNAFRSSGNVLLNGSIGPKIWLGGPNFSFSIESQMVFAATALDMRNYKGLGALSIPIIGHFNFKGNSGFGGKTDFRTGFSFGGGVQYNRTELFGLTSDFIDLERTFFPTYVGEVQLGVGGSGIGFVFYTRYGLGYDFEVEDFTGANSLNIGVSLTFNITRMKKAQKEEGNGGIDFIEKDTEEGQIRQ